MSDTMPLPEPSSEADFALARRAIDLGMLTREQVEEALLRRDQRPGVPLLDLLPLTEESRQALTAAPARPLPEEIRDAARDPDRRVGKKYVVAGHLGTGGMGMVLKAYDTVLDRWVALKFLKAVGDEKAREYFDREARLAAGLSHPHIASIHEVGEHHGQPYIVIEYIDGESLHAARKRMNLDDALRAMRNVCDALAYAHGKGVIHRDMKPGNLMLSRSGRIYVMDFGLAKQTVVDGESESLGGSSVVVGTAEYMAPEQARGRADAQSDVYGIGAILYELVTGRPPFTGETSTDILLQVVNQEPVWPRKLTPGVPEDLEAIILHALEKDKRHRYAGVAQLLEDLQAFLDRNPLRHARHPTFSYVLAKRIRKQPLLWAFGSAMILAVAGGAAFGVYWLARAKYEAEEKARVEAEGRARTEIQRLKAERSLAQVYVDRAQGAYRSRDLAQMGVYLANALATHPDSVPPAVVQDLERRTGRLVWCLEAGEPVTACAVAPDERTVLLGGEAGRLSEHDLFTGRELRRFPGHEGSVLGITYSPDGLRAATAGADRTVRLWDLTRGAGETIFRAHERFALSVAFSPDGRRLYSSSDDRTVMVWDAGVTAPVRTYRGHTGGVNAVSVGPGGALLATASDDHTVRIWSDSGETPPVVLEGHLDDVSRTLFTPDGKGVLSSGGDGVVHLWDLATRQITRTLRGHQGSVTALALSRDGTIAVTGGADNTLRVWDLRFGQEIAVSTLHRGTVADVRTVEHGRYVLSCGRDGRALLWERPASREARDLPRSPSIVRKVAFHPGGRFAISAGDDGTVRRWDTYDGSAAGTWTGHTAPVTGVAWSPDGRWAVSGSHDETLRIWDGASGKEQAVLKGHRSLVWGVGVSPDGRWILSGGADRDVHLWDRLKGGPARLLQGHADVVNTFAFSPDGRRAVSAGNDRTAIVWEIPEGRELRRLGRHRGPVTDVAFSADGRKVVTAAWDDDVLVWNADDASPPLRLPGHADGSNVALFSADSRTVVSGGRDGTIRLWDLATARETRRIPAHHGRVYGLALSPEGSRLLSCGLWGMTRMWDLESMLAAGAAVDPETLRRRIDARSGMAMTGSRVEPLGVAELTSLRDALGSSAAGPPEADWWRVLAERHAKHLEKHRIASDYAAWWDARFGSRLAEGIPWHEIWRADPGR
jgi:eukaryotic-like serine/threonine-protein kinase